MELWMGKLAGALLMPPLSLLLLVLFGLLLTRRRRRGGMFVAASGVIALWLLCTPVIGNSLLASIEPKHGVRVDALESAQAIVVLGGGTYFASPEYAGDTVGTFTLERLRWAARLHRQTGLPVMVTGGLPLGNTVSEAAQMRDVLEQDFQVRVKWLESRSDNTLESAGHAREILSPEGIARIVLVTHASHMPRAQSAFVHAGFEVMEAPTAFSTTGPLTVLSFLPGAYGLMQARIFCHEVLGIGWYHVRRIVAG